MPATTNTDGKLWRVFGPAIPGYELHRANRYATEIEANARACHLAKLHKGREFHTAKVVSTFRNPEIVPPIEMIRH